MSIHSPLPFFTIMSLTRALQITSSGYTWEPKRPVNPVRDTEERTVPDPTPWLFGEASIDDFMADPISSF